MIPHPGALSTPIRTTSTDLDWWLDLAPTLAWQRARTYDDFAPHSYVVRDKQLASAPFDRAVRVIRTFGQPGKFWNSTQIYLHASPSDDDQTKWWTMSGTVADQGVINRATDDRIYGEQNAPSTATGIEHHLAAPTVYDELSQVYDARYTHPSDLAENTAIRRLIMSHFGAFAPTVLDVGCGTGLTLDLGITAPTVYTGVDPSQGMLNELVRKHPRVHVLHPLTVERAWLALPPRSYDAVLSLFGSPSYIDPAVVALLPTLSRNLTCLMHYEAGYLPDYWGQDRPDPDYVDESRHAAAAIPGARVFTLNHFQVTVVGG